MTSHYNDLYARCDDIAQAVSELDQAIKALEAQVARLEELAHTHQDTPDGTVEAAWTWAI